MKDFFFLKKHNNDDRGSTLITVIVAIGFVTILASIILGTSLTSFRMKAIDRRAKDDFYYSEKALNDIYTGIGQKIAVIAGKAYDRSFSTLGKKGASVKTARDAEEEYKIEYVTNVVDWLDDNADPAVFQKFIVTSPDKKAYVTSVGAVEAWDAGENDIKSELGDTDKCLEVVSMRVRDVSVVVTDTNKDYKSEIVTDIVITIPRLDFFDNNADVVDYAIIANKGIIVNGDVNVGFSGAVGAENVLDGSNVYAGLTSSGGGLTINRGKFDFEGNYLISKGDITVGSDAAGYASDVAQFVAGKIRKTRPNIWFDSITTKEKAKDPVIDVDANTFALNDTELNANKSKAKFKGAYYGYDQGYFAKTDTDLPEVSPTGTPAPTVSMLIDPGTKHSDSSAIIINGNECTLDMKGLNTLVLMGKAYIEVAGDGGTVNEISTAEANALKTNQQLYLVPPDFLTVPNPSVGEIDFTGKCMIPSDWFGYKYMKKSGVGSNPVIQSITVTVGGDKISYAFLLFDDVKTDYDLTSIGGTANMRARSAFIYEIMHGVDDPSLPAQPTQSQLKTRLSNSLANYANFRLQECVFNNSEKSNIYSVNALVNYKIVDEEESLDGYNGGARPIGVADIVPVSNNAALDRYATYPQNLFRRYQWLCTMLNPNEDIPLSQNVPAVGTGSRGIGSIDEAGAWTANSAYPYKYYVYTPSGLSAAPTDVKAKIPDSSYGQFIYSTEDYSFSGVTSPFKGVVICTGNITVPSTMAVEGTLIAGGTITFTGGNTIKGNKALLQKRIAKETDLVKSYGSYYSDFLISYLDDGTGNRLYGGITGDDTPPDIEEKRINYTDYIFFENWKKGGR